MSGSPEVEALDERSRQGEHSSNLPQWIQRWHVGASSNKEYEVIDGLRGLAILMVVATHLFYINPKAGPTLQFIAHIFSAGTWGVTIFFTLSGFLIAYPFWKRKIRGAIPIIPRGYAGRRFWKIYPPLALSILLFVPIYIARTNDYSYIGTACKWLIGWPLILPITGKLNPVMWSLVVEVQFYVLLPLLFLCCKRVPAKQCVWLVFITLLVIPTCFRWWNISHGVYFRLHPEIALHFPALLDAFSFGVLLAGIENFGRVPKRFAVLGDIGLVLLAGGTVVNAWVGSRSAIDPELQKEVATWVVKIAAVLMLCYIADASHPRTRLLSQPWLRWLGLISYEWYLFHQPLALWARASFGPANGSLLKFVSIVGGAFVVSLLLAAGVYRFFSLPILKFGRNRHVAR